MDLSCVSMEPRCVVSIVVLYCSSFWEQYVADIHIIFIHFVPFQNWQMGWYHDKAIELDEILSDCGTWKGRLYGYVDYKSVNDSANNGVVLIKVDDIYIQYNRITEMNEGTKDKGNQISVTQTENGLGTQSWSLVGLTESSDTWEYKNLKVDICRKSHNGNMVYYDIVIRNNNHESICDEPYTLSHEECGGAAVAATSRAVAAPTGRPTSPPTTRTNQPTTPPTPGPTVAPPTPYPTRYPTSPPTRLPTNQPTTAPPTPYPTRHPTKEPTSYPTHRPTSEPTTPYPTPVPTPAPTPEPTPIPDSFGNAFSGIISGAFSWGGGTTTTTTDTSFGGSDNNSSQESSSSSPQYRGQVNDIFGLLNPPTDTPTTSQPSGLPSSSNTDYPSVEPPSSLPPTPAPPPTNNPTVTTNQPTTAALSTPVPTPPPSAVAAAGNSFNQGDTSNNSSGRARASGRGGGSRNGSTFT
mmetsp:Transcript_3881/g.5619  ORF Transcript_3881/g.5619 Transcript_3881/m.5619 type:complete len:465 (-) Transcript_3881:24-1418(-)